MYTFTNHFSKSELKNRIQMLNRPRSGWRAAWRYGSLLILLSGLLLVCQCQFSSGDPSIPKHMESFIAKDGETIYWIVTPSMTDKTLTELHKTLQGYHIVFKPDIVRGKNGGLLRLEANLFSYTGSSYPESILHEQAFTKSVLKKNNIDNHQFVSAGNGMKPSLLPALGFWYDPETGFHSDVVTDDFPKVLQKQADSEAIPPIFLDHITKEDLKRVQDFDQRNEDKVASIQLIDIASQQSKTLPEKYATMSLEELINIVSRNPALEQQSYTLDMNRLLEVSFMKYRQYMLRVTDDYHLDVLPEYRQATITIDEKPATLVQLRDIHVRQVDWAYVRRKGELERVLDTDLYEAKYAISIRLAPRRAKRDSSYYVFSPFYQGDF